MRPGHVTRRSILKAGAGGAAFAATATILTPRRTLAARDQKLVFWLQPNFNPTADRILEEHTRAFARQAGSPLAVNMVLLGALGATKILPFPDEDLLVMIRTKTNPKFLEANLAAFRMGQEVAAEPHNWQKPLVS